MLRKLMIDKPGAFPCGKSWTPIFDNIAVVPDYTEVEVVAAGKENHLIKSTSILAAFPTQIVLGKETNVLATGVGNAKV
jgi:hypothetical protein